MSVAQKQAWPQTFSRLPNDGDKCVKTRTAFHTNQLNVQERCGEYREGPTCPEEGRVQGRPLPCACGLILGKLLEVLQFFK